MRLMILFSFLALPAAAWEFDPAPICTLRNDAPVTVEVTYDAGLPEYAIRITRPEGWPNAAIFALRFDGEWPLTITTDRHEIDGAMLIVRDRGFGNVLNGMARNQTATALIGDVAQPIDLTGAAAPLSVFLTCPGDPAV